MIKAYFTYQTWNNLRQSITAVAGFLLAFKDILTVSYFVAMLVGLSFIIASGCVF